MKQHKTELRVFTDKNHSNKIYKTDTNKIPIFLCSPFNYMSMQYAMLKQFCGDAQSVCPPSVVGR